MRSRTLIPLMLLVALVTSASSASAAPQGHTWRLTPMAGWTQPSPQFRYPSDSLKAAPIFGGRLGYALNENWQIEAGGAWAALKEAARLERDVTYLNASGSLVYTPVTWRIGALSLAAGGGWQSWKATGESKDVHFGTFEQAVGWTSWFNDKAGLRLEARNVLSVPHTHFGDANQATQQYWGGLTFALGGKPRDTDGDGVPDKKDKCPGTPKGCTVDAKGCPVD